MIKDTDRKYHGQFGIPFSKIHRDRELAYVVPVPYKLVIGIVGPKCSGKTVITSHLVEDFGYQFYSLSRFVRDEVTRLSAGSDDRAILKAQGDTLRRRFGRDVLARRVVQAVRRDLVERQEPVSHIVIDGIKNLGEVEYLKRLPRSYIMSVVAGAETRHQRAQSDGAFDGEVHEFVATIDAPDSNATDECGQQVDRCLEPPTADFVVTNELSKRQLLNEVDAILARIGGIPS